MEENTSVTALAGTVILNKPSVLEVVPPGEPFIVMLTNGIAMPSGSEILPETVRVWAKAAGSAANSKSMKTNTKCSCLINCYLVDKKMGFGSRARAF